MVLMLSIIAAGSSSTSSSMLLVSPSALSFDDFAVVSSLDDGLFVVAPPAERWLPPDLSLRWLPRLPLLPTLDSSLPPNRDETNFSLVDSSCC